MFAISLGTCKFKGVCTQVAQCRQEGGCASQPMLEQMRGHQPPALLTAFLSVPFRTHVQLPGQVSRLTQQINSIQ